MQLLQNSFIFKKKKKKSNCCGFWETAVSPFSHAVQQLPPRLLLVPGGWRWVRDVNHSGWERWSALAGFCHECWALWMSLEYAVTISRWVFRVPVSSGVFLAFKADRLWVKLPWGRVSLGSASWDGACEFSLVGKGKPLLNCTFSDPLTSRLGTQQPG